MARQIRTLQPTVDPFSHFVRIALKIFGILFLVVGLALWGREIRFGQTSESAQGTIIEVRVIESADGPNYAPVVEFIPQDGRVVHFQGMSTSPKPEKGTRVTVLYNKSNPEQARIDSFVQRWLFPTLFTPIGFLMILGAGWWKKRPANE